MSHFMPTNTAVFLLGLAVGSMLLILGLGLGYWLGRKAGAAFAPVQGQQFLAFLRSMSQLTSEFSGDVLKYQNRLSSINERVQAGGAPREEMLSMVADMMEVNRQLQSRLESNEKKLEAQTDQLASYLKEARTDGLTGLLNRRAFDHALDELMTQWQKQDRPFCIGLIDIDHFKQINDTYGHPVGDEVLKQVARLVQSELPDAICVARFGGEEFSLLTLASPEEAAAQLETLRGGLAKTRIEHEGKHISVTLSAGLSQITSGERVSMLVRRADEALYASKLGGRNQVHYHDGSCCRLITRLAARAEAVPAGGSEGVLEQQEALSRVQERLRRIVEEESQRVAER